jgi:hypothetical protein
MPASSLKVPERFHDPAYERPVLSRYVDPVEVIWLSTARRLGITLRRDPTVFSMTDGSGTLWLSTREHLDADDCLAQMIFHEFCHWVTNGRDVVTERDWGFPLYDEEDVREHGCLRLQAWWAARHGLRDMMGPTGQYRQYYDQLPQDPLAALDDSPWDAAVRVCARQAVDRAATDPWWAPIDAALAATRAARDLLAPFLTDYQSEFEGDRLPLLWEGAGGALK